MDTGHVTGVVEAPELPGRRLHQTLNIRALRHVALPERRLPTGPADEFHGLVPRHGVDIARHDGRALRREGEGHGPTRSPIPRLSLAPFSPPSSPSPAAASLTRRS